MSGMIRTLLAAGGLLTLLAIVWILWSRSQSELHHSLGPSEGWTTERSAVPDDPGGSLRSPRQVRILLESSAGTKSREPQVLARLADLGPLSESEARWVRDRLREIETEKLDQLSSRRDQTQTSVAMLEEADLVLAMQTARAAAEALSLGSYTATAPDAPAPSLALPASEVVRIGALKDGKPCTITIIMAWKSFAQLAQAREFRDSMQRFDDTEKARAFNALPDAERAEISRRLHAILSADRPSDDDRAYLLRTIGFNTKLPRGSTIAIVPDR